jgi:hypothetical protein
MFEKLWFLVLNDDLVGIFDDYEIALEEKDYLKEENRYDTVVLKKKIISNIPKNSEEYVMAKERGYVS